LRPGPARPPSRNAIFRRLADGDDGTLDLVGAYVLGPSGLPPQALEGVAAELTGLADTPGYLPLGYAPLRRAIAEYQSRGGLATTPDQVLITAGAQQAIDLVARHLIRPGEAVVLEDPTYPGAIDILDSAGGRLVAAPTGRLGVDVNALADVLAEYSPGLVYLIPTFHNPVGSVLPERSRRDVARLIESSGVTLLEDTSVAELSLDDGREPPPSIASFAGPDAPVIVVGSCSKLFWGGLRVGWVRAAEPVIAGLTRLKVMCDLGGSLPSQVIAARLFDHIEVVRQDRRRELRRRLQLVEGLLHDLLPDWTWERPLGGACLWVRLPYGNASQLAQLALRHGVSIVPGPVASPQSGFGDYLRLPFSLTPDVLEEGLRRLAQAWSAYRPDADSRRQSLSVIV
jgi:DNA-binding transcriptional MocR family regulator